MLTTTTIAIVAFLAGLLASHAAGADDRKKAIDTEKELADLRSKHADKVYDLIRERKNAESSLSFARRELDQYYEKFGEIDFDGGGNPDDAEQTQP